jgi:hypothetical protein
MDAMGIHGNQQEFEGYSHMTPELTPMGIGSSHSFPKVFKHNLTRRESLPLHIVSETLTLFSRTDLNFFDDFGEDRSR